MGSRESRTWLPYAAAIATLLAAWQITAFLLPDFLMPGIGEVVHRLSREVLRGPFLTALHKSLTRLAVGYAVASMLGVTSGLIAGASRPFRLYMRALISVLQSIPPITWIPLLLILMGFGDRPIMVVVAVASFFPMALSVMNAAEGVNPTHVQVAQIVGANRLQILTKVYAPEVFPAVISGAQVSFGNAWRSLIAAEMVGGVNVGLGWSISFAGEIADMAGVLMGIVIIGSLATLIDRFLLERLKRKLLRWRYV